MALLRGSSRQVLAFIAGHWIPLIQLSVAPAAIMALLSLLTAWVISGVLGAMMMGAGQQAEFDPAIIEGVMRAEGISFVFNICSGLTMVWLFVRVVRYYALGELNWASLGPAGFKPVLLTALYSLGIAVLTFLVYLAGILLIVLVTAVFAPVFGDGGSALDVIGIILLIGAFLAFLVFITWFFCRFAVGLPGVALGRSPDFFKDMWGLARGESWGVPWRLILAALVFGVVAVPVIVIIGWPFYTTMLEDLGIGIGSDPELAGRVVFRLMLFGILGLALQIPWVWFSSLLLAEAYRRFSGRPGAPAIR